MSFTNERIIDEYTPDVMRSIFKDMDRTLDPTLGQRILDKTTENVPKAKIASLTTVAVIAGADASTALAAGSSPHETINSLNIAAPNASPNPVISNEENKLIFDSNTHRLSSVPPNSQSKTQTEGRQDIVHTATILNKHTTTDTTNYETVSLKAGGDSIWKEQARAFQNEGTDTGSQIDSSISGDLSRSGVDQIAKQRGISVEQAAEQLPVNYKAKIEVEFPGITGSRTPESSLKNNTDAEHEVTVKKGDYLSLEAEQHGESLQQLLDQNSQYKANPNFVLAGAKIKVSGQSKSSSSADIHTPSLKTNHKASSATSSTISSVPATKPTGTSDGGSAVVSSKTTAEAPTAATTSTTTPPEASTTTIMPTPAAATKDGVSKKSLSAEPGKPSSEKKSSRKEQKFNKENRHAAHHDEHDRSRHSITGHHDILDTKHVRIKRLISLDKLKVSKYFCDTTPIGNNTEQIIFNYDVVCEGLDKSQAAGQDGNEIWESRGDATIVQGGTFSLKPTTAAGIGWGVDQSTPGIKMVYAKDDYHVKGNIDKLITQENIIRMQMHGTSPTQNADMIKDMEETHTPQQAAELFEAKFEEGPIAYEGGGSLSNRQALAGEIYSQFKDTSPLKQYKEAIYSREMKRDAKVVAKTTVINTGQPSTVVRAVDAATKHHKHDDKLKHDNKKQVEKHRKHHRTSHKSNTDFVGYRLSGSHAMKFYDQCNPAWADEPYGNPGQTNICESDCGGDAYTMINNTLGDHPMTVAEEAEKYGPEYHTDGTSWSFFPVAAEQNGLKEINIGRNMTEAGKIIHEGGLVEGAFGIGHFTTEGHFMVIRGETKGGNFYLADPNNIGAIALGRGNTNDTAYNWRYLLNQDEGNLQNMWAFLPESSVPSAPIISQPIPVKHEHRHLQITSSSHHHDKVTLSHIEKHKPKLHLLHKYIGSHAAKHKVSKTTIASTIAGIDSTEKKILKLSTTHKRAGGSVVKHTVINTKTDNRSIRSSIVTSSTHKSSHGQRLKK